MSMPVYGPAERAHSSVNGVRYVAILRRTVATLSKRSNGDTEGWLDENRVSFKERDRHCQMHVRHVGAVGRGKVIVKESPRSCPGGCGSAVGAFVKEICGGMDRLERQQEHAQR